MPQIPVAEVTTNKDGTVTVQYVPRRSGPHDLNVQYNDAPVQGTPLRVNVDSANGNYISAYGPGLVQGASGQNLEFYVTGNAKDIEVKIEGPGKADIVKKEQKDGTVAVVYLPLSPGEYDIHIKHKGRAIHGSPFSAKISGEGRKRSQMSFPATSEYTLGGKDVDLTNMVGTMKTPSGGTEPCLLKKMADGKLAIASFQPKVKGTYNIEVTQDGKSFPGSPFKVNIDDHHVCYAPKVKVAGAIKDAIANTWNDVTINIADAGYGSLGFSVEGAHRSDLELKSNSPTEYVLEYKPHEPGVYLLNIKFGDDHVTGSPFIVSVGGDPSGRIRETVVKQVQASEFVTSGQKCSLQLKIPGTDPLDMEALLTSPSGSTESCEIRGLGDSLCQLNFTPKEDGVHTVSLKYKGIHFAGSPFQYTVGKTPVGGPHKVEFGGPGAEKGEVGTKNEFNIYYHEAGAGTISVSIEGPSKAEMEVVDRHGYITCGYTVSKPGDYGIHVKFNDEHVPESPATVYIAPVSGDAKKISFCGLRDRGLEIGKPTTFSLQTNGAKATKNSFRAFVDTPSGTQEDVFITDVDDERYALRFVPRENGVYYVHIKFNEAHIPGSPLPLLVGKLGADPALVFARGDGLEKGESGKPAKFTVVTANAGAGTLAVHIEGPSKVALVCTEVSEGYEFSYTPTVGGNYMIMIKYSNITIAGAPFKATVAGPSKPSQIPETSTLFVETVEKKQGESKVKRFHGDASRVVAQGNGLHKGFAGRASVFTLDVKDGGQAMLTVGMISPSGNPVNDLTVKKLRATTYNVSYTAQEKGDHTLVVRWGADDIHGSPFIITVA
jgi:filamin